MNWLRWFDRCAKAAGRLALRPPVVRPLAVTLLLAWASLVAVSPSWAAAPDAVLPQATHVADPAEKAPLPAAPEDAPALGIDPALGQSGRGEARSPLRVEPRTDDRLRFDAEPPRPRDLPPAHEPPPADEFPPTEEELPPPQGTLPATAAQDDIWLISSRQAPCAEPELLRYWRYRTGCWVPASLQEFLQADDPSIRTCFWIHGYMFTYDRANRWGWDAFRRFQTPGHPQRFVIWSWPTQKAGHILHDARRKARRSDLEGSTLAWLVDQLHPDTRISFVGYSYGGRLVASALHVLGGGTIEGRSLPHRVHPHRRPITAIILAGALNNFAFQPGESNDRTLSQVNRLLVTIDSLDRVLRVYPLLGGWHGPRAMGQTGVIGDVGPYANVLHEWDVTHEVGRSHAVADYLDSPVILPVLVRFVNADEPHATAPAWSLEAGDGQPVKVRSADPSQRDTATQQNGGQASTNPAVQSTQ
jgi:hypothetical protein